MFCGVPFYNTCLNLSNISRLFSGGTTVCSTFLQFSSITAIKGFGFINILAILFPVSYPVSSVVLKPTFWKQFSHMTFHIFCIFLFLIVFAFSHICWLDFSQMTKIHTLWHILLLLLLKNNVPFIFINKQCQINFVFCF